MLYEVTFIRNGKIESVKGTRAQVQALADYLSRTLRIESDIKLAA